MPIRMKKANPVEDAWLVMHQTSDSVTKCEEDAFSKTGITMQQFFILGVINSMDCPVTPTSLANWIDRNQNSITLILDRMEKDGLIERKRDMKDRRAIRLSITLKGQKKYRLGLGTAGTLPHRLLAVLSPEEQLVLATLLRKVREETFKYRNISDKVLDVIPPEMNTQDTGNKYTSNELVSSDTVNNNI